MQGRRRVDAGSMKACAAQGRRRLPCAHGLADTVHVRPVARQAQDSCAHTRECSVTRAAPDVGCGAGVGGGKPDEQAPALPPHAHHPPGPSRQTLTTTLTSRQTRRHSPRSPRPPSSHHARPATLAPPRSPHHARPATLAPPRSPCHGSAAAHASAGPRRPPRQHRAHCRYESGNAGCRAFLRPLAVRGTSPVTQSALPGTCPVTRARTGSPPPAPGRLLAHPAAHPAAVCRRIAGRLCAAARRGESVGARRRRGEKRGTGHQRGARRRQAAPPCSDK
jgi:hypothetical protein